MNEYHSENGRIHLFNMDCMEYMAQFPDNYFELAIVDPPYGIDINMNQGRRKEDVKKHDKKDWDAFAPDVDYWNELVRVSSYQIIWGANNFEWIPPHNGWIVWDKDITGDVPFSKAELAYCSKIGAVDMVRIRAQSGCEVYSNKIHPTQKPVKLYEWLLKNYAKDGDKILDTHLGSASSAIAAHRMGFEFFGTELDGDYFAASIERFERETAQLDMFAEVAE